MARTTRSGQSHTHSLRHSHTLSHTGRQAGRREADRRQAACTCTTLPVSFHLAAAVFLLLHVQRGAAERATHTRHDARLHQRRHCIIWAAPPRSRSLFAFEEQEARAARCDACVCERRKGYRRTTIV